MPESMPAWILENQRNGFTVGTHDRGDEKHITSYEEDLAYIESTGEKIHYCHHCQDLYVESQFTPAP